MKTTELRQVSRMRELAMDGRARKHRLAARLSLGEVARTIRTTPSTLQRWETGKCRPPEEAALRWARLLIQLTGTPL